MLITRKYFIFFLTLLVAFAPIPSLIANAVADSEVPCLAGKSMEKKAETSELAEKSQTSEQCIFCQQDGNSCQQCDCTLVGCVVFKVHQYSESTSIPKFSSDIFVVKYNSKSPPNSQNVSPLLRPPIQLLT